jgi:plastocyanin
VKDPETIERVNRLESRMSGVEARLPAALGGSALLPAPEKASGEPVPPGDETTARIERVRDGVASLEEADRARRKGDRRAAQVAFGRARELAPEAAAPFAQAFGEEAPAPIPAPAPPAAAEATRATLTGTVKLTGPFAESGLATVVAVRPLSGPMRSRRPGRFVMRQSDKTFEPHVLAIPTGSTVSFPNQDKFFHNVYSVSPDHKFDLGVFSEGKSGDQAFEKPGVVHILCNLHAFMSAFVVVLEDPYFTIADSRGQFSIKDVQPGRYRVWVWNERSKNGASVQADLKAGGNRLDFTVVADQEPKVPPDKHGKPRQQSYRR